MKHLHKLTTILVVATAMLTAASCANNYQEDIDALTEKAEAIEGRVGKLETDLSGINGSLKQISALAAAVEQNFYITAVNKTADGYELAISNGTTIFIQEGQGDGAAASLPSIGVMQLGGMFFWTTGGVLLTDATGTPVHATEEAPILKYDADSMCYLISVDGGVTFKDINAYASVVINNRVLMQVINNYFSQYSSTLIDKTVLFQIISTYIQDNYKSLFNIEILDEVVAGYIREKHERLFSYTLLEQIFTQYDFAYYTSQIDVDKLVTIIVDNIQKDDAVFMSSEVLYEIISSYVSINDTSIFTSEMLLEVINNFFTESEVSIDINLLTQVVTNYIDHHRDEVFNTRTVREIMMKYVQKYYVNIFREDILVRMLNVYVSQNSTTIINETLLKDILNVYIRNNSSTVITNDVIRMIVNDYVRTNTSTIFNETVLYEVVDNYFQKNYNRHIDRTVFETSIRTYIEKHHTTIISVDIVENIVTNYLKAYYLEIFDIDVLSVLVRNYFEENMTVMMETIRDGVDPVAGVNVVKDSCTITMRDGTTFILPIYDAYTSLKDRLQSVVVLPGENGKVKESAKDPYRWLNLKYLVSPAYMAQIIESRFNARQMSLELMVTDGNGNISSIGVAKVTAADGGRITVQSSDYTTGSVKAVSLRIRDNVSTGGDITSEFIPVYSGDGHEWVDVFSGEIKYENINNTAFGNHSEGSVVCSYEWENFSENILNNENILLSFSQFRKHYDIDNVVIEYYHNGATKPIVYPQQPYYKNMSAPCVAAVANFDTGDNDHVETSLFTIRLFDTIEENCSGYVLFKINPFDDHEDSPLVIKGEYKVNHPNHVWTPLGDDKLDENTVLCRGSMYGFHKRYKMASVLNKHFKNEFEGWIAPGNHSAITFSLPLVNGKEQAGAILNDATDMFEAAIELTDYLTEDKVYTIRQFMDLDNGMVCTKDYYVKFVMPFVVSSIPSIKLPTEKNLSYYGLLTVDGTDGIIISENKEINPAVVYNSKASSDEIENAQLEYGGLSFIVESIELLTEDGQDLLNDARLTVDEDGVIKWDNHGAASQKPFKARYRVTYYVDSGINPFTDNLCRLIAEGSITCMSTDRSRGTAVDLGLPSGIKWASCNVGAETPEEYGDYFAWGETEPYYTEGHSQDYPCSNWKANKTGYDWASYKWCNGSSSTLTKYNYSSSYGSVDNNYILDPEDDAAAVNWGDSWRMPTDEDWTELRTECTWTWTTRNGVNGRLVTGPNGNSIFLPAAGDRSNTGLYGAGSYGLYWSSSLDSGYPYFAPSVNFFSDGVYWDIYYRYVGQSVRPVTE